MVTTMKVSAQTRDAVNTWAREHGQTADEALADLVWRAQVAEAIARLDGDSQLRDGYDAEALALAEVGIADGLTDKDRW